MPGFAFLVEFHNISQWNSWHDQPWVGSNSLDQPWIPNQQLCSWIVRDGIEKHIEKHIVDKCKKAPWFPLEKQPAFFRFLCRCMGCWTSGWTFNCTSSGRHDSTGPSWTDVLSWFCERPTTHGFIGTNGLPEVGRGSSRCHHLPFWTHFYGFSKPLAFPSDQHLPVMSRSG